MLCRQLEILDAQNEKTGVEMNGSSEKNLMERFESSIRNPLDDKTGQPYFDEFSKCTKDKLSEVNVLHITNFHMFIKALGYCKYSLCKDLKTNCRVFFRGQERLYGDSFQPALYRGCTQAGAIVKRNQRIKAMVAQVQKSSKVLRTLHPAVVEGLLQHYGAKTRWIDAVDNLWVALWFACHHAWCENLCGEEHLHYSLRDPRHEEADRRFAYIYVLAVNTYRDKKNGRRSLYTQFIPGLNFGEEGEVLDLRYALPSQYIRPHVQHGVLLRTYDASTGFEVDMCRMVKLIIRIDIEDALSWLGESHALSTVSMFPPAIFDTGYQELLRLEKELLSKSSKDDNIKPVEIFHTQRVE